ncbi:MAG: NAD kinase [Ottowia sp.]|nr:NAD kinase [Ottowia sp.]
MIPSPFPPFRVIALSGKSQDARVKPLLIALADFIQSNGNQVIFETNTAKEIGVQGYPCLTLEEIGTRAHVAVVLGGDGTMLSVGRRLAPFGIPLIGVNLGRLGFMTDIPASEIQTTLQPILAGQYVREARTLLQAHVMRGTTEIFSACVLNDVVVSRAGNSGMVELAVSVNEKFMYHPRADGLIVATPTGSTAYALAAGGPILHPELEGIVLVPIAPQALSNRPIVLPHHVEISIEIISTREVFVNFDMQSLASLLPGDRVIVKRAPHTATFLHPLGYNYFSTLRQKLRWHDAPLPTHSLEKNDDHPYPSDLQ